MRRLAAALLAACLLPAPARADVLPWPGVGRVDLAVPGGWELRTKAGQGGSLLLHAQPRSGAAVVVQVALLDRSAERPVRASDLRGHLEQLSRSVLEGSVERTFEPKRLALAQGSGWVVELTDASLVGKPPEPGNYKKVRSALAALDEHLVLIGTVQFDDPASAALDEAMALLGGLRVERIAGAAAPTPEGPFDFTVPQSQIILKVGIAGLRSDPDAPSGGSYFKRSREEPMLIVSGWFEPAERFAGVEAFWARELRSPAYAAPYAPIRVEFLKVGGWDVIAFDVAAAGGTMANLRAERVQAGTWIDLHLSTASKRPPAALREELLAALRAVEVAEKPPTAPAP